MLLSDYITFVPITTVIHQQVAQEMDLLEFCFLFFL